MNMRCLRWPAAFAFVAGLVCQQPLTHDDYDQWKSLRGTVISPDGSWVAYQIEPQWGDGVLEVRQALGDVVHRIPLASGPRFSADGRFVAFMAGKSKVEERQKKIEELRKKAQGAKTEGETPAAAEPTEPGEPQSEEQRRAEMMRRFGAARQGPGGGAGGGPGGRGGRPGAGAPGAGGEPTRERADLAVLDLATGKVETIGKVKGFALPEEGNYLIYHVDTAASEDNKDEAGEPGTAGRARGETTPAAATEPGAGQRPTGQPEPSPAGQPPGGQQPAGQPPAEPAAEPAEGQRGAARRGARRPGADGPGGAAAPAAPADPLERKRKDGTALVIRDLASGQERRLDDVVGYGLLRKATWLYFHTSAKKPDAQKSYGLFATRLDGSATVTLVGGFADFGSFTSDRNGTALAFTSNLDDFAADKPRSDLWLWDGGPQPAQRIVHPETRGMPKGMQLGSGFGFSRDGGLITLSLQDPPAEPLPEVLPDEKVVLDLWHHNDGLLQPAQQRRGGRGREARTAVYHRGERRLQLLGDDVVETVRLINPDGSRAIGTDAKPYEKLTTWDGRYGDVYLVNTVDGSRSRVLTQLRTSVTNSPGGRYLIWFGPDYRWWTLDTVTMERRDLTGNLPVVFHRDDDDHPEPDPAHGIAGWTKNDAAVLLYDQFDVWQVSPQTGEAVCVTDGFGRKNRIRLRVQRLPRTDDEEDDGSLPEELLLAGTDTETMAEGFYSDRLGAVQKPREIVRMDKRIGELRKPRRGERLFFTLSTFDQFPDLWTSEPDFGGMRRLSHANPQQKDYRWGKAELVRWRNADGVELKGVLVKPDDFDPKRKYPMMVYFYERMSQNLHSYVAPSPGTSPNAAYYVSNGYLWFTPDIVYTVGYPGDSCVKCVVSGVQHLIAQGFVDEQAIGAAGHSWGGYQTAYLVTRTNIFAAVESGAPVCNMISAYGGIRYESGVSRQFQYEQTQSRIGGTPWEYPLRYWENSPIFFADKIRTPVLILHNDNDGAVPWTQGIEFYTALRRLGREVYLFNYNGEPHGLRKRQNMKDWSRRMSEYFGHHLKGLPKPKWMEDGVPYGERDREKLPFTPSWVEAYAAPKSARPVEGAATRPAAASAAGEVDVPPAPAAAPATPRPPARPAGPGSEPTNGEAVPTPQPAVGQRKKLIV